MINTNELAAEYRLGHWAQIIQERIESGLSIRAYCVKMDIHENTYFYWQRKLRESVCTEIQVTAPNDVIPSGWMQLEPK